jgi:hypothetical protein
MLDQNFLSTAICIYLLQVSSLCSLVPLLISFIDILRLATFRANSLTLTSLSTPPLTTMLHKMRSREVARKVSPPQPVYMSDDQKCWLTPMV